MFISHKQLNFFTKLASRSFGVGHFNDKKFLIFVVLKGQCKLTL